MLLKFLWVGLGASLMALAGVLIFTPAHPETTTVMRLERALSQAQLKSEADAIILGTFQTARTYTDRSSEQSVVLTEWTVKTHRTLKGSVGDVITVTLTGGLAGSTESRNHDLPAIQRGQRAVMYLQAVPDRKTFIPLSLRQGLFLEKAGAFTSRDGQVISSTSL